MRTSPPQDLPGRAGARGRPPTAARFVRAHRALGALGTLSLLGVLSLLVATVLTPSGAQAAPVTVLNGTQFTDVNGDPLHAHGGGVIEVDGYYYWFCENRQEDSNGFRYVSAYRSTDLRNWEFRNHVLTQ